MVNMLTALLVGVVIGGLAAVVYFSYTGTNLKWKK